MASGVFNQGKRAILDGTVNLTSDTIKMMLLDNTYVPNVDSDFVSSIVADELSGTGYVGGFNGAGRKTLTGKNFSTDDTNDRAEFNADPLTWAGINAGTAAYAVLIKEVTNDAASILIAWLDFAGGNVVTSGNDLIVTPNVDGLIQAT